MVLDDKKEKKNCKVKQKKAKDAHSLNAFDYKIRPNLRLNNNIHMQT